MALIRFAKTRINTDFFVFEKKEGFHVGLRKYGTQMTRIITDLSGFFFFSHFFFISHE